MNTVILIENLGILLWYFQGIMNIILIFHEILYEGTRVFMGNPHEKVRQ